MLNTHVEKTSRQLDTSQNLTGTNWGVFSIHRKDGIDKRGDQSLRDNVPQYLTGQKSEQGSSFLLKVKGKLGKCGVKKTTENKVFL